MKEIICLYIFLISFLYSIAQPYRPFPEDSAQWSVQLVIPDSLGNPYILTHQLKMIGDTVVNGMAYNKIYKSFDINYPSSSDTLHCFIRQDTSLKKVFIRYPLNVYNDSSEILLYDFSLQVGDTFNLKLIVDGSVHQMTVNSIGSYPLNTGMTREFSMQLTNPPVLGGSCDVSCSWLEGIGCVCNLLYTEMPQHTCDTNSYSTACFWQNGIYVLGGTYCNITEIEPSLMISEYQLRLFPNPITSNTHIATDIPKDYFDIFNIYNSVGEQIRQVNYAQLHEFFEKYLDYPAGIYLLVGYSKNSYFLNAKFLITK